MTRWDYLAIEFRAVLSVWAEYNKKSPMFCFLEIKIVWAIELSLMSGVFLALFHPVNHSSSVKNLPLALLDTVLSRISSVCLMASS